jgi:UDP-N-acetylmuramate--alanine ligase
METYGHDFARLKSAFVEFLQRMPFYGAAVLCVDDPARARDHAASCRSPIITYGFSPKRRSSARSSVRPVGGQMHFKVLRRNGRHAAGSGRGTEPARRAQRAQRAVGDRGGGRAQRARRRLAAGAGRIQRRRAAFPALRRRSRPGRWRAIHRDRRLRPPPGRDGGHAGGGTRARFPAGGWCWRSSRTATPAPATAFEDFVKVIGRADVVLLAEVYAAGEAPIVAADGRTLARAVRVAGRVEPTVRRRHRGHAAGDRRSRREDGDVVLCMGAGSIGGGAWQVGRIATSKKSIL